MSDRFVSFSLPGQAEVRIGVVVDESVAEVAAPDHSFMPGALAALLALGPRAMREAAARAVATGNRVPLSGVRLLPPIPRPGKIICLGLNYADHAAEGGNAKPSYPSFFMRGATSLIGHDAPLLRPRVSAKLDFEAELAVVIGRRARHLAQADALSAVAGYACFNDATLRDYQRRTAQWTIGKNFDGTGAFGPWLVPAAGVAPGAAGLKIESRLNGRVMQSDNTANMLFPVAETLCLLTEAITLEPGDVIAMGTPAGVGYARTPPVWMQPGDRIEIEIEGIGILANTVQEEA
ncbi:5-oxopent-3-ene-1,2,5-tricarboxylate decarboxylase [Pigmentiphaga sp. NML080357]|uniref:fumarylacetoacetate hydrolase family protein n=1 Tax=Pigmentiphaga sp. NML080357 TaxID=2008675 RepID=UPI000B41CB33|nr:fumarylacetoacetate hydrolase family protein [Pigmentiphaga sp. NML080357]OVZ55890.1 5-oxopent-3-ene-1,2,5-tricarboxylate decarboxylase [Pigmentiphaga sp. NML080357]